jgi:hypothetical protein
MIRHTWGTTGTREGLFPAFQAPGYEGVETAPFFKTMATTLQEVLQPCSGIRRFIQSRPPII